MSYPFHKYDNYVICKSFVRTADGKSQQILGWIQIDLAFKGQSKQNKLFIISSLSSRLILEIDFWRAFNLVPNIISSTNIFDCKKHEKFITQISSSLKNSELDNLSDIDTAVTARHKHFNVSRF